VTTLSFGVKGPTQDWSVSLNINDTDSPRILAWLSSPESGYGTITENIQSQVPNMSWSPEEGQTEEDRPTTEVQQWVTRQATPEEAAKNYAEATLKNLLNSTVEWERAKAIQEAIASITPIDLA
jgi:hypothetical protein